MWTGSSSAHNSANLSNQYNKDDTRVYGNGTVQSTAG